MWKKNGELPVPTLRLGRTWNFGINDFNGGNSKLPGSVGWIFWMHPKCRSLVELNGRLNGGGMLGFRIQCMIHVSTCVLMLLASVSYIFLNGFDSSFCVLHFTAHGPHGFLGIVDAVAVCMVKQNPLIQISEKPAVRIATKRAQNHRWHWGFAWYSTRGYTTIYII